MRGTHLAAAIFLLLPVSAAPNSGIIQVTGLRSWSHPGSTRVVLETTGLAEYRADHAQHPERLFFDIVHARPWIAQRRIASHPVNDALVKRVRVAETTPGTTRVVFDLNAAVDFKVSRLDTPDRIVIELTPSGAKAREATVVSRPPFVQTAASTRTRRAFVPPVLDRPPLPRIPLPDSVPEELVATLGPLPAWPAVRLPRKLTAAISTPPSHPPAPPASPAVAQAFINTTTKVLPAVTLPSPRATAKASTDASLSLTRALGLKINRVVIDAGHGGHDDGTIGPNGVLEKDVVLDVALRLASLVQAKLGAEVVLTRSDDTFVPLTERTAIANQYKADLFLSIHANSSPAPAVAGTETFLLNLNSSPGAISVAARENAGSDKSVGELRDLIQSIALNDKIAESQTFATNIEASLSAQAARGNAAAHDRGVKKAPFVVLIGAKMPSVLAEIGFLSNPRDESNLGKGEYRQKIAESLYRGLAQYSQSLSHYEVAESSGGKTSSRMTAGAAR